eukprot:6193478-Pleurochrysis_carterae.AAC.2
MTKLDQFHWIGVLDTIRLEVGACSADFVRCPEDVGAVPGYVFASGADGCGYYRQHDAPPPDGVEYSRMVLQRASAAGATFVGCPAFIEEVAGYEFRQDGAEGSGYYLLQVPPTNNSFHTGKEDTYDEFLESMKEMGAM